MPSRKICKCGLPSIPGLVSGVALCQYHYNKLMFGENWANYCKETTSGDTPRVSTESAE